MQPILLNFDPKLSTIPDKDGDKHIRDSLSAVVCVGRHLWLASDETTRVECLSTDEGLTYNNHRFFELGDFINLPGKKEVDIEGLDYHDGFLWLVGSHSATREKAKKGLTDAENIERLGEDPKRKGNRYILARIPITDAAGDDPRLDQRGAQLPGDAEGNTLTDAIAGRGEDKSDPPLASFLGIPGKENGFDIEGLAVQGERVFLGLRGPVLRGWAIILELSIHVGNDGNLMLRKIGSDGRPYRKYFLQLEGFGIRDLCIDGQDLLILAGPTMDHDGIETVYRWKDGMAVTKERLVWAKELTPILSIPFVQRAAQGKDHAEGMALVTAPDGSTSLLVVYDNPSDDAENGRVVGVAGVRADLFVL